MKQLPLVVLCLAASINLGLAQAAPAPAVKTEANKPDAAMQKVLDAQKSLGGKPIETLTPAEARKQPSVADAVKRVMKDEGKSTAPSADISAKNLSIPGAAGPIAARIYTPTGQGPFPVIVYYHGGGWVLATLDTYDASARSLATEANAIVISADYRHAPEHPFPAAHQDAFAAYKWALSNAAKLNGDPAKVAVAGESAGGNLAANVSMMARDAKIQLPVHELLIYPVAGTNMTTPSYIQNANAKPLNKPMMQWFTKYTLPTAADKQSKKIDLVHADLHGMPPTTIITAEIDPLRSEGQALGERLKEAGVDVSSQNFKGVTHEFFGMGAVVPTAKDAEAYAGKQLTGAFATSGPATAEPVAPAPAKTDTVPQEPQSQPTNVPPGMSEKPGPADSPQ